MNKATPTAWLHRRFVYARRIVACVLAVGALASTAAAQVDTVKREVAASGVTRGEAVLNALQEATFRICGVRIQSSTETASLFVEDDGGATLVESVNRQINVRGKNPNCGFDGYDVLRLQPDGDGYRAVVRVRYTVYRVPGPDMRRRTLAVLEFPVDEVHLYGAGGGRERTVAGRPAEIGVSVDFGLMRNLEDGFRARIEELLTQGRRFGVLDRRRGDVYEAEKRALLSPDTAAGERARLGRVLGADYLVYGAIDRIAVEGWERTIEISGERYSGLSASARVRFTVLATATRQVKWSSSLDIERAAQPGARPEIAAQALLDEIAAAIADELTENIYPPRIVEVLAPGQFALNRGGNTVAEGDVFEVFALGGWLTDPDTGERLDRLEISVGVARIVDVKPKYSLAELISEDVDLAREMVLRRRGAEASDSHGSRAAAGRQPGFQDDDGDGLPDYLNRQ